MSIDDWAQEQAEKQYPHGFSSDAPVDVKRGHFADGIVHVFSALLSDEAVEAAATGYWKASMEDLDVGEKPTAEELEQFVWAARIVLHAAIDAVTKEAHND